jgi:hypothetical protein
MAHKRKLTPRQQELRKEIAKDFQKLDTHPATQGVSGDWPKGVKVYARDCENKNNLYGRTNGTTSVCGLKGCKGIRVNVLWPDGAFTRPCTEKLKLYKDGWIII